MLDLWGGDPGDLELTTPGGPPWARDGTLAGSN